MKRASLSLLILLLTPLLLFGQSITVPKELKGDPGSFIKVPATTDGKQVRWYSPDTGLQVFPVELLKDSLTAVVISNTPGTYRLIAWTAKGDVPSDPAICTITIGTPTPPVPPVPPVPPTPPDPPAPAAGKRVLIIYETADAPKLPEAQQQILFGKAPRDYLNSHCDPDGSVKAWRIWDKDVDASNESKAWQDAMKRPRTSVPWMIVSNGTTGWEGPLPASVDEAMKIWKKYLGD